MSYQSRIKAKMQRYGQTIVLHREGNGDICPGYDETSGYCDPQYHREHPEIPQCNSECRINAQSVELSYKAFVQPMRNFIAGNRYPEVFSTLIGEFKVDDTIYIGPADVDVTNLGDSHYITFENQKYTLEKPDAYKIGDEIVFFFAVLRLIPRGD